MSLDRTQSGIAELFASLEPTVSAGSTAQYYRGDKTWVSLPATVTWSTLSGKPTFAAVATSGSYSDLSNLPTLGPQLTVDTGWTVNNTVGDKTAALSSYSNGLNSTMIAALNVASTGTGTAISAAFDVLVVVVKQLAAVRTALVAQKIPNV
jgi:hypothetical protein